MRNSNWRRLSLAAALALILMISAGCGGGGVKVKDGDKVKVDYTLTLDDGTEVDSSAGGEPLEFQMGTGAVISGFEEAVLGMTVGQTKKVKIAPANGYGERDETLVQIYERSKLPEGLDPEVGMYLQAYRVDGSTIPVRIVAFNDTTVTVDGNHQLAGQNLNFVITLVEIVE